MSGKLTRKKIQINFCLQDCRFYVYITKCKFGPIHFHYSSGLSGSRLNLAAVCGCYKGILVQAIRAPSSNSGVSDQQGVGSNAQP